MAYLTQYHPTQGMGSIRVSGSLSLDDISFPDPQIDSLYSPFHKHCLHLRHVSDSESVGYSGRCSAIALLSCGTTTTVVRMIDWVALSG